MQISIITVIPSVWNDKALCARNKSVGSVSAFSAYRLNAVTIQSMNHDRAKSI